MMTIRSLALISAFAIAAGVAGCSSDDADDAAPAPTPAQDSGGEATVTPDSGPDAAVIDNKALVVGAIKALFIDKDESAVDRYFTDDFVQHNPQLPNGKAPLTKGVQALKTLKDYEFAIARSFVSGDLVGLHSRFVGAKGPGTSQVNFDIFRVKGQKLVEHWNCEQTEKLDAAGKPAPNPSGHTMTDGPTGITDLDRTVVNGNAHRDFLDVVLVQGHFDQAHGWFIGDGSKYTQHNPNVGDGLKAFATFVQSAKGLKFTKIGKVIAEGDFVLSQSEGFLGAAPNDQHLVFYDLFRWAKDPADGDKAKIVEHWDCIWPYVDPSKTASGNPML